MTIIKIEFFEGMVSSENKQARDLLNDLAKNPGSPSEQIEIVNVGESDFGIPTVLYDTLSFKGIKKIKGFCTFMKESPGERNQIVSNNFRDGAIGF